MVNHKGSCTVCRHTRSEQIDEALVAGISLRSLSKRYGLSPFSLARHKENHVAAALRQAAERALIKREDGLLGTFEQLVVDAHRIRRKAELAKDYSSALGGIREITRLMELAIAHQPKGEEKPFKVHISFSTDGRIHARRDPLETSSPALPADPETAEPTLPEPQAPLARAPEPPRPVDSPRHVCTPRCNPFTCSFKNKTAQEHDEQDPWRFF